MLRASVESALVVGGWIACVAATGWVSSRAAERTTEWSVGAAAVAAAALVTHGDAVGPAAPPPPPLEAQTPRRLIGTALDRARGLEATPMRAARAAEIVDELVDVEAFTQRSFGAPCPTPQPCRDRWAMLDPRQKAEMVTLSKALLTQRVSKYARELSRHSVAVVDVEAEGATMRVRTQMTRPGEPPLRIDYVVANSAGRYRIVNVVAEGSSMAKNHYDQYARMLDDPAKGYPHLVARVQKNATPR